MASIVAADILEGPNEGGFRHQKNQAIQIQQDKGGTISPDPDHPDHAEKLSFKTLMATRVKIIFYPAFEQGARFSRLDPSTRNPNSGYENRKSLYYRVVLLEMTRRQWLWRAAYEMAGCSNIYI